MPLRVALLDSGVAKDHPHLAGCHLSGFSLDAGPDGAWVEGRDFSDRTGHGTACAAAFFRGCPSASLLAVRLLDEELRTTSAHLAAGIGRAVERGADLIVLSLGSRAAEARAVLAAAVDEARAAGVICVASAHPRGATLWPADLPTVISAAAHRSCPAADVYRAPGPLPRYVASGWPRPIEGRPPTDNLYGPSFAAVHVAARLANLLEEAPSPPDFEGAVALLDASATGSWGGDAGEPART